jgi:8-oxo-dGTP pyrophosphatase MutT (NUDIX family)
VPISSYLAGLRRLIGNTLLIVPAVAAIIRDPSGRVLLMKSSDGGAWSLPAGAIDPGETPARAIEREVHEETGLVVRAARVAAVLGGEHFRHAYSNGDRVEYSIVLFECRIEGGELEAIDGEAEELAWFAPEEMPALCLPYPAALFDTTSAETFFERDT